MGIHARNWVDEKDLALEGLAEEIHITRDHLAFLEGRYARLSKWQPPDFDPDPGIDQRRPNIDMSLFPSAGTDVVEEYRVVDVSTGDRL